MSGPVVDVVEVTHPGSVWAWSSEAKLRWLRARYGERLRWRRVFADGTSDLGVRRGGGSDEAHARALLDVAGQTGAPVPATGVPGARSAQHATEIAKASELQGDRIAERVLRRLREAIFVAGVPVITSDRVRDAVDGLGYLDFDRLLYDARSAAVEQALLADRAEARALGAEEPPDRDGRPRLPIVVVTGPAGRRVLAGWQPAIAYDDAVREAAPDISHEGRGPLTALAALERYRSLTIAELELLAGTQQPPLESVPLVTATTPLFVHADDVESRAYRAWFPRAVGF